MIWQPIDSAPLDGTEVLISITGFRESKTPTYMSAFYDNDVWRSVWDFEPLWSGITHWQTLPPPPNED